MRKLRELYNEALDSLAVSVILTFAVIDTLGKKLVWAILAYYAQRRLK